MKKIIFTPDNEKAELVGTAPISSVSTMPDWYKKIPARFNSKKLELKNGELNSTVKLCSPFLDAMTAGYTFVLNEDILVTWENGNPMFNWRTDRTAITFHSFDQSQSIAVPDGYYPQVIKFENNFQIKTPDGYSLWCTHPSNRFDLPFQTVSGFVDTDKYNMSIQFPFFIKMGWEGVLGAGTPVAQLIPVKRDSWKSEIKNFDKNEQYKNWYNFRKKIVRSYKVSNWSKKTYN